MQNQILNDLYTLTMNFVSRMQTIRKLVSIHIVVAMRNINPITPVETVVIHCKSVGARSYYYTTGMRESVNMAEFPRV